MYHGLENIETISLDHDLGDEAMTEYYTNVRNNYQLDYSNIQEKTGYDCCKWLVNKSIETGIPIPQVYVHSANPIGSANMMGYINNYLMNCRLQQTCVRVNIPHTIEEHVQLSPEARKAKWDRSKEN
jgi:thioester reductase-like protein